jgi:hypothetical protein
VCIGTSGVSWPAEVVGERAARQGRAGGGLAGEHVDLLARDLLPQEREGEPGEVRAAADAADDDVRKGARELHLRQRLLADDGLMEKDVVEDAPQRVGGVLAARRVLDGLGDGDPEAARRVGIGGEDRPARVRLLGRARDHARAPGLHHRAAIGLLVVRDLDHVHLALEAEEPAGEREGASPLARAGLGRQPLPSLLPGVIGLGDSRVRLVAPRGRDPLVLVEDA